MSGSSTEPLFVTTASGVRSLLIGTGSNKVIVLHGWLGGAASWFRTWPYLDREEFTYAFVDCRGYGESFRALGQYTMEEIADDVIALAGALGWPTFSLVGHSMGGMAAQRVLLRAGTQVRSVVGVTPVPANGSWMPPDRLALFNAAIGDNRARREIIDATTGRRHGDDWLDEVLALSQPDSHGAAVKGYLRSWTADDFAAQICGNPTPVRVLVGEHDPSITLDRINATWARWYPRCTVSVLSGVGHYPMLEAPTGLVTAIQSFIVDERSQGAVTLAQKGAPA